ncbi:MAG: glycosyltransferase family 2 protein, partial [Halanaeroarchaeum sp.]
MGTVAVIPAYNEAKTVGPVIDEASRHVEEAVVIDDGSTDDTADVARDHGATVIEHVFNTGVGGAVRTGYLYAIEHDYEFVVQIDADGQHD